MQKSRRDAGVTEWPLCPQAASRSGVGLAFQLNLRRTLFDRGQEFFWQWIIWRFFLPHYCDDPPARAVAIELKAIDAAGEGLFVFCVVARFVGAEDLHDV